MIERSNVNIGRRRFVRFGILALALALLRGSLRAEPPHPKPQYFNVPEGEAINTLKLAVKQANVEVMLAAGSLKGVRTQRIQGYFTPIDAFNLMLSGSSLRMERHEHSGVYAIKAASANERKTPKLVSSTLPIDT